MEIRGLDEPPSPPLPTTPPPRPELLVVVDGDVVEVRIDLSSVDWRSAFHVVTAGALRPRRAGPACPGCASRTCG